MTRLVWLSDLHYAVSGPLLGHDPVLRLRAAIAQINTHHCDAHACVITGDLAEHGLEAEYRALAQELAALAMPVYAMTGNHDDRRALRAHITLPAQTMPNFVQYAVNVGTARVICLDSVTEGADHGSFCAERLAWLADALAQAGDRPVLVFLHHPPLALGLPMLDPDRLRDSGPLLDLLCARGTVRHLGFGHVHRPVSGSVRGLAFTSMRSVLYQAPPPEPAWDWDTFSPADEAPEMGVISLTGDAVTVQFQQICPASYGRTDQ
ncbi:MAG: phosphodiesterase [Pseudomonadota bacterium]